MEHTDRIAESWRHTFSVRRVFGEPIEKGGVTAIPVAMVAGWGAGGNGSAGEGSDADNGGSVFAGVARPAGMYVVRDDGVEWQPALDITLLGMAGIALAALMTLVLTRALRRRR